jgi:phosphoglycerol transferase MdoB-like AlkP superfamily enzyme
VRDFFRSPMQVVRRFVFLLVLAQCAGFAATPKGAKRASPTRTKLPNIILITLDTTRANRMGYLGSERGLTPNLDALARQSVVFTRAYAQVPLTTPSHAALLTGTYPEFSHLEHLGAPLGKDLPLLAGPLAQARISHGGISWGLHSRSCGGRSGLRARLRRV